MVVMTKAAATTTITAKMASLGHKIWNKMQNEFDMVTSVMHALPKIQCHNDVPQEFRATRESGQNQSQKPAYRITVYDVFILLPGL